MYESPITLDYCASQIVQNPVHNHNYDENPFDVWRLLINVPCSSLQHLVSPTLPAASLL